jgi:hypothetical protein
MKKEIFYFVLLTIIFCSNTNKNLECSNFNNEMSCKGNEVNNPEGWKYRTFQTPPKGILNIK